jgi:hypothetical protein
MSQNWYKGFRDRVKKLSRKEYNPILKKLSGRRDPEDFKKERQIF